jgi:hypothetical protein
VFLCYRYRSLSDVAAGNSNTPAEGTSPAEVEEAVTVGAVDSQNNKACFSNYGPVLDGESPLSSLGQHINATSVWDLGVEVKSAVSVQVFQTTPN